VSLRLASYKLRFHDRHVRAVPLTDAEGCPFAGPGIDLRGEIAEPIFAASEPMRTWLDAREPGIALRSLSVDRKKERVLVTLEQPGDRPRVLRFDPPSASELIDSARELERLLGEACAQVLARR
jgi:hypothetical protein